MGGGGCCPLVPCCARMYLLRIHSTGACPTQRDHKYMITTRCCCCCCCWLRVVERSSEERCSVLVHSSCSSHSSPDGHFPHSYFSVAREWRYNHSHPPTSPPPGPHWIDHSQHLSVGRRQASGGDAGLPVVKMTNRHADNSSVNPL